VVFRLGFAPSRKAARQLVLHRHLLINGKIVNIPSYLIKAGDVISVRDKSKKLDVIHNTLRRTKENVYEWLQVDKASLSATFMQVPARGEVPLVANEQLIVELYSKSLIILKRGIR